MGKFFSSAPAQRAGSWPQLPAPGRTENRTAAVRLMVGHITSTVQQERNTLRRKGASSGRLILAARARPRRFPHRLEKRNTKSHMYAVSFRASQKTRSVMADRPPSRRATLYTSIP